MALLDDFRAQVLEARKSGDEHATFLVMVLSDINNIAKADVKPAPTADDPHAVLRRQPTDDDAAKVINAQIKQLALLLDGSAEKKIAPLPADSDYAKQVRAKLDLLKALVPGPLTGEPLQVAIREAADFCDTSIEIKSMGAIMKRLNEVYPGRIDGAEVKTLILSGAC
jgi:uncharacterized protein YqeY